ncbi:MAG: NAD(P)-binding protein [Proteobacteria bacterium]|nr:NAD(P)-binding protein [Pseudomonadota bacterium]
MVAPANVDVVVVGGGVGGLAVAWNLTAQALQNGGKPPSIMLAEASGRWGGNADTFSFTFGTGPDGKPLDRWCDLGVNDFNVTAYTKIVSVMNTIGFKQGVDYKPLEDTTCYFTADGSLAFTDNSVPWWGTGMSQSLLDSANSFMTVAGNDATKNATKFQNYTIEKYINEQGPLQTPPWDPDLGPLVIYPRINGMYFVSELGPRSMPFLAVMHYYAIQEGAGGQPAYRCYFVDGASAWITALVGYMQRNMPNITFMLNYQAVIAQVRTADPMYLVQDYSDNPTQTMATTIVLAAHADDCLTAFIGMPAPASAVMGAIRYNNGISVAHTDSRVLPVNSNCWCTYNILIHDPGSAGLKPYVINYVANRHQNDAANPAYDQFGLPQFFVSCNPHKPIPENMILKDAGGNPAVANLRHNNFDFATLQAQSQIHSLQGMENIYYAGGWTHGSGLHEECWAQGEEVAALYYQYAQTGVPKEPGEPQEVGKLVGDRLKRNAGL